MLKNDSLQFVGASKLIKRHYFFFKNGDSKTAKFLDRKIYVKNNTFTSTFNMQKQKHVLRASLESKNVSSCL